jgi:hypothetical protein
MTTLSDSNGWDELQVNHHLWIRNAERASVASKELLSRSAAPEQVKGGWSNNFGRRNTIITGLFIFWYRAAHVFL